MTEAAGIIKYSIRFFKLDSAGHGLIYNLNTLPTTGEVQEGISMNYEETYQIVELNPGTYRYNQYYVKNSITGEYELATSAFDASETYYQRTTLDSPADTDLKASFLEEIANTYTVDQVDELLRNITKKVYEENGVILSAIGIYSIDVTDKEAIKARKKISKIIEKYDNVLQMHGFYYNEPKKTIQFDIVVSFDEVNQNELYKWADPENLPTLVGGTCTCPNIEGGCLYSDIGPWNPNGGIQVGDKNTNKGAGSTVQQVISA